MACTCSGKGCKCSAFASGKSHSLKNVPMEPARGQTVVAIGKRGGKSVGKR